MTIQTLQANYNMTVREAVLFMAWNAGESIAPSHDAAMIRALNKFNKRLAS